VGHTFSEFLLNVVPDFSLDFIRSTRHKKFENSDLQQSVLAGDSDLT
jgi:hypothetical protein